MFSEIFNPSNPNCITKKVNYISLKFITDLLRGVKFGLRCRYIFFARVRRHFCHDKWRVSSVLARAIIGDGDCKRGIHAVPLKKTNVLFLEKIAPPSTS